MKTIRESIEENTIHDSFCHKGLEVGGVTYACDCSKPKRDFAILSLFTNLVEECRPDKWGNDEGERSLRIIRNATIEEYHKNLLERLK